MGKVRVAKLGDVKQEEQLKKKAEVRREAKKAKKVKVEGLNLEGGQRVAVVEGTEINPEFKKLIEESKSPADAQAMAGKQKAKGKAPRQKSKRYKEVAGLVDKTKLYSLHDAVSLVKKTSITKFDGTVEIHVNLSSIALNGKTDYRGTVTLPHGTGKQVKVRIADDELLKELEGGNINFDILIAHPSIMSKLAKYARTLGPKGLMPNPKNGTVSQEPEKRAKELSTGQVNFKTEPNNLIIHMPIGKVSFEAKQLSENVVELVSTLGKSKITRMTLSSTMGPGIKLDIASV